MKTKLILLLLLGWAGVVWGQVGVNTEKDYNELNKLNQFFKNSQKLKNQILEEEKEMDKLISVHPPTAENIAKINVYKDAISLKKEMLKRENLKYSMFTNRAMSKMFENYNTVLSGSKLQNGVNRTIVGSVDDKGIQGTYSDKLIGSRFFFNANLSGKTEETSKDGFLSVFSKNNFFNNNVTYSGGIDIFFFLNGSKRFTNSLKDKLHMKIDDLLNEKIKEKEFLEEYKSLLKISDDVLKTIDLYDKTNLNGQREINSKDTQILINNLKKLKKLKVISTADLSDKDEIKKNIHSFLKNNEDNYFKEKILLEADSLQIKTETGIGQQWFSLGGKYNLSRKKILDSNFPELDTLKTKNYTNDYISIKISFNYFRKFKRNYLMFSPTINFSDQRNFNDSNLIEANKIKNYSILGSDYQLSKEETIAYFGKTESRVNVFSLEFPTSLYFKKNNFGLDLNFKLGVNDPNNNNISAKLGFYIPIRNSDNKIINIEPLIRFVKLFSSGKNDFIKDNTQIGFILSATIPTHTNIE